MARETILRTLPTVAIRGIVVFPNMQLHFEVSRKQSISALKAALAGSREVFLVLQKDIRNDNPLTLPEFNSMGVICNIKQLLSMPNTENVRIAVEGVSRATLIGFESVKPHLVSIVRLRDTVKVRSEDKSYAEALMRVCKDDFEEYSQFIPKMPTDLILSILSQDDAGELADFIAGNTMIDAEKKQLVLNEINPLRRIESLCAILRRETDLLTIEEDIQARVQEQIDQNQREYYLREQLKAISIELDGEEAAETDAYREKIAALTLPEEDRSKLLQECSRLEKTSKSSPEAMVIRTYLDTCISLPWGVFTKDKLDLVKARKVLDADHYGMEKVKDRIIELLAVRKLSPDIKGQIICLVGPPGVGKTSVARSVARAMGRKYARISLGGVRDEAEIRGHRKTYIGAMPGRIITTIQGTGSSNPLVLLDEVDKLGSDFRGDPSAALLEVLDGEQNDSFRDHYIEIPFDLSRVLFLTTANDRDEIPAPLLDRMEIIELGSYTREEKFNIAKKHLIPKQLKRHGLSRRQLTISDDAVRLIIDRYVREAGVRKLERELASICRKATVSVAAGEEKITVKAKDVEGYLGAEKYKEDDFRGKDEVGIANGLAWTSVGGEMLEVEAAVLDGSGKIELTGSLGDVMKESAMAAVSYIRSRAKSLGVEPDFYKTKDIHLHFPEGAVPKDGPSAGVTIVTALNSALSGVPVRGDVAMTGEITLRGRVLPIGGLKEKTMAAYRAGIKTVIIPLKNKPDLDEIDSTVKNAISFVFAEDVSTVLETALVKSETGDKSETAHAVVGSAAQRLPAITQ